MNTNSAGQGGGLAFRWLGPIIVLSGGVFIGFAPILMRYGLESLGPQSIAFWRFTLAIPILLLHSVAATRSREIVQILEEQAAGLIATHAESK